MVARRLIKNNEESMPLSTSIEREGVYALLQCQIIIALRFLVQYELLY